MTKTDKALLVVVAAVLFTFALGLLPWKAAVILVVFLLMIILGSRL